MGAQPTRPLVAPFPGAAPLLEAENDAETRPAVPLARTLGRLESFSNPQKLRINRTYSSVSAPATACGDLARTQRFALTSAGLPTDFVAFNGAARINPSIALSNEIAKLTG